MPRNIGALRPQKTLIIDSYPTWLLAYAVMFEWGTLIDDRLCRVLSGGQVLTCGFGQAHRLWTYKYFVYLSMLCQLQNVFISARYERSFIIFAVSYAPLLPKIVCGGEGGRYTFCYATGCHVLSFAHLTMWVFCTPLSFILLHPSPEITLASAALLITHFRFSVLIANIWKSALKWTL